MKKWYIIGGVAAILIFTVVAYKIWVGGKDTNNYRTTKVEVGDIIQTVKATGTVQPVDQVQVGSQVTGRIVKLYVDYNSKVKKDEIIAKIDPASFKAKLDQDQANLLGSQASVEQAKAKLYQAEKELERDRELMSRELISQSDLDASIANRNVLAAQLKLARASVSQNRAALRLSQTSLNYTNIISPVDGVVIARNVDEGQTVVASLSAQVIFTIATDLKKVQVQGSVPEADISKIRQGGAVTFTVDSFPNLTFQGTVSQVRMAATTVQNVVTYPVIIDADNADEKLMPGMTANISFEVARKNQVLKVPNAALRFKPEYLQKKESSSGTAQARERRTGGNHEPPQPKVWIQTDDGLKEMFITTGITDGSFTEVTGGDLKVGMLVVTGVLEAGEKQDETVNPFMPKMPSKRPPR